MDLKQRRIETLHALIEVSIPELMATLNRMLERIDTKNPTDSDREIIDMCIEQLQSLLTQDIEEGEDLSAQTIFNLMQDPSLIVTPKEKAKPSAPNQKNDSDQEMSDDKAQMLLAAMDEPVEKTPSSKADTSAKNSSLDAEQGEMSEEEAQMLLAAMDEPIAQTSNSEAEGSVTASAANEPKGDMSDDEANMLLAAMDSPSESEHIEPSDHDSDMPSKPTLQQGVSEAQIEEIDEWEANDFQTDPDMITDFINNSDDIMVNLDEAILSLEKDPNNPEIIEEIFRGAHTLKGAAGMFGFKAIERTMHRMENLFDLIRKKKLSPTPEIVDTVFEGLDLLRELLTAVKNGSPCGAKTAHIVAALEAVANGQTPTTLKAKVGGSTPVSAKAEQQARSNGDRNSTSANNTDSHNDENLAPKNDAVAPTQAPTNKQAPTIRVDLGRLDDLVNLIGELVIDRTRFVSIEDRFRNEHPQSSLVGNIAETVQFFGRHMSDMQEIVMKLRMVPIGNTFNKYPRIIRDLARSLDKRIDLQIIGEHAKLDKTLVELIDDPLVHLIRNACDHGIESPDQRLEKGKPENGTITLAAEQEGNHIIISIKDDGKGMDPEVIKEKGIKKGLISEDEPLSPRDIFNLIFEPGFSTAETVTNISGRGVGMDVVKKQITKLKGMIDIDSQLNQGTTITIRLPLTLAIVQNLLVRIKTETFAIPLASVIESIRIEPHEIQNVGTNQVINLRDKIIPLVNISEILDLNHKEKTICKFLNDGDLQGKEKTSNKIFVVIVGHENRSFGIVVDQLLTQQEMVIKSLGMAMQHIPCIAGGAVRGDGSVVLVRDIAEIEDAAKGKIRSVQAA